MPWFKLEAEVFIDYEPDRKTWKEIDAALRDDLLGGDNNITQITNTSFTRVENK